MGPARATIALPDVSTTTSAAAVAAPQVPATTRAAFHPDETFSPERTPPRASVEPLTADLLRLHVTVCRRFLAKLDAARAALSHARPGAGTEEVLEAALDLLLATHEKTKAAVRTRPERPRPVRAPDVVPAAGAAVVASATDLVVGIGSSAGAPGARYIPAAVRREVWARDGGCCQWPLAAGGVCGSRTRVEFDHVVPKALGGSSDAANVRLLCRAHNGIAARQFFGETWMDRFTRGRSSDGSAAARG